MSSSLGPGVFLLVGSGFWITRLARVSVRGLYEFQKGCYKGTLRATISLAIRVAKRVLQGLLSIPKSAKCIHSATKTKPSIFQRPQVAKLKVKSPLKAQSLQNPSTGLLSNQGEKTYKLVFHNGFL